MQPSRVPLVITYNPALRSISSIIQRHFKIFSSCPRCDNVFQTTPLVAFRRTDNLSDILARSKFRTDKQTNVNKRSLRSGKNCITCCYVTSLRKQPSFFAPGPIGVSREGRLRFMYQSNRSSNIPPPPGI